MTQWLKNAMAKISKKSGKSVASKKRGTQSTKKNSKSKVIAPKKVTGSKTDNRKTKSSSSGLAQSKGKKSRVVETSSSSKGRSSKPKGSLQTSSMKTRATKSRKGRRGELRRHLDERLRLLHQRAMVIEEQLRKLDENRFYRTCIFGSARIKQDTPQYAQVFEVARYLAWEGIDVLTGGGPGLMEAANRGALLGREEKQTETLSFGLSIQLEFEPEPNKHLDIKRHHHKFSSRLDDFMRLSHSVVCTPGGIGTLLEFFFVWQLIQVKHATPRPIVLLEKAFWGGILDWMHNEPLAKGLVGEKDFGCIHIVDTPEEVFEIISAHHQEFRSRAAAVIEEPS